LNTIGRATASITTSVAPAVTGHVLLAALLALVAFVLAGPVPDLLLAAGLRRMGFSPENVIAFVAARGKGRGR